MKPTPWFSRSFNCPMSNEVLPCILERLAGTPSRMEEKLANLPVEVLVRRHADEKWSIQEEAGHLLDLEWLWFARTQDFSNGAVELTPADLSNRKTFEAEHNLKPISEILSAFRMERQQAVEAFYTLPETALSHTILHPRLKTPMRFADFAFFVAEHDDHHLAMMSWKAGL